MCCVSGRMYRRDHQQQSGHSKYATICLQFIFTITLLLQNIKHGLSEGETLFSNVTWHTAYNRCHALNMSLPSADMIQSSNWSHVTNVLPVWLYAFQVKYISSKTPDKYFTLGMKTKTEHAGAMCIKNDGLDFTPVLTYKTAKQTCADGNYSLLQITTPNMSRLVGQRYVKDTPLWIDTTYGTVEETLQADSSGSIEVRCLLLDETGDLQIARCSNKYSVLCVNDSDTVTTVRYIGNTSLPVYSGRVPVTSAHGTSKSDKTAASAAESHRPNAGSTTLHSNTVRSADDNSLLALMDQDVIISLVTVAGLVLLSIVVAICCCCCCNRGNHGDKSPHLAEAYSETADTVTFKEHKPYENNEGVSEYATPEDAMETGSRARHRDSIVEGEYDTLQQTQTKKPTKKKIAVVNAYSHVAIVQPSPRMTGGGVELDENQYDVTNYTKQAIVKPQVLENPENIYGRVDLKPT